MDMKIFTGLLSIITKKNLSEEAVSSEFIFYKIVHFNDKQNKYMLQCFNTKATFLAKITDIISDEDILFSLHPIQACYIGIEYVAWLKQNNIDTKICNYQPKKISNYSSSRYGTLCLHYEDRKKNVCFKNLKTGEEFIMDPRDIALSEHLIREFDAIQAFYVGVLAGLKMNNPTRIYKEIDRSKQPKLFLVK
jgi:hypothetical protein